MKYYKLKTVVFYIFATTITSFDLKGGENENNKDFKICAFKIKSDSTINDVFEYFKDASTWVNDKKNCLILFIKDQNGSIVSLES